MESWEPLWVFARRKSATVPLVWLSRRPEWFVGAGIAFSRKGLATVAEVGVAEIIGEKLETSLWRAAQPLIRRQASISRPQ